MAKKFPTDEFDSVTTKGGRHRRPRTAKNIFFEWMGTFIIAAVLTGLGYLGLKFIEDSSVFSGFLPTSNSSPTPTVNAKPGVTVLFSGKEEPAKGAGELLKEAGFNIVEISQLVDEDKKPVKLGETIITITDEIFRAEADAIATHLGLPEIVVSPQFAGPITVALSSDYKLPVKKDL